MNLARTALGKIRLPLFALLWGGNLLLLLLGFAWLQIPDSHTWQFVLSMLSAFVLACAFCWLQVTVFARLRGAVQPGSLWIRMLAFAILITAWFLLAQWIASGNNGVGQLAYYWNSRLSASHRIVFTPARIVSTLNWVLLLAQFFLAAILIPAAIELGTRGVRGLRLTEIVRPWKRWQFWLVVYVAGICSVEATSALVNWIPGHGVGMETFSVLARLIVAWTFDALLWLVVLATAAAANDEDTQMQTDAPALVS
jgi:hypothetical protein